jgi:hypothetical protein
MEEAESQLRRILGADFLAGRWGSLLRQPVSGGGPLNEISDTNLRRSLEISNWRMLRVGLLRELKQGRSLLKGPALIALKRLRDTSEAFTKWQKQIDEQAENLVRKAHGVPLIGQGWVSETELFNLVRDVVAPLAVVQHARLPWLGLQHLDIYVPDLGMAIEYMGEQHFRAVEFFGGEGALQQRKELDKKKAHLCRENGIQLVYVTPDDAMSVDTVEKLLARSKTRRSGHPIKIP